MNDPTAAPPDPSPVSPARDGAEGRYLDRFRRALERIDRARREAPEPDGAQTAGERKALDTAGERKALDTALAAAGLGWWEILPQVEGSFWDDGMRRLFGLELDDPVGPGIALARMRSEDRAGFEAALRAAVDPAGSGLFQVEYRISDSGNGAERWIWSRGRAFFEQGECVRLLGVAEDITVRKRAEQAALDDGERLALAVEAAEIGIWSAGPSLADLRWDDRVRALFGLRPGMPIDAATNLRAIHEADRSAVETAIRGAFDPSGDGLYDIVFRALGIEDGIERTLRAKGKVRFDNGVPARFLGAVRDISAERRAEALLAEAAATLERRVAERTASLERASVALARSQKMEAVGQLTGAVAHDFNNILTGIGGSLELIGTRLRQNRVSEAERLIARAETAVARAASLTERMLAFSRIRPQETRRTDLNMALDLFAGVLRQAAGPFVSLETSTTAARPHAMLDPDLLRAALISLVQNAREAMPGGGTIRLGTAVTTVGASPPDPDLRPGDYAVLTVEDDGVGMTEQVALRAFDPFFTTKPLGQDAGLGLSIVWGFARQSGGTARMDSRAGQGTTVTLTLPLVATGHDAPPPWPGRNASAADPSSTTSTVLVVEDDEVLRPVVAEVLTELGTAALQAESGAAGLRMLADGVHVDLVVADLAGSGAVDGIALVEAGCRIQPGLRAILIVGAGDDTMSLPKTGRVKVLRKPFTMRELADGIVASLTAAGEPP